VERRTFLAVGVAALGLAGCTDDAPEPPDPTGSVVPTAPDDPDSGLRSAVARSEAELIATYRSAISSRPDLARDLAPFLAHHEQHLGRVLPGVDPTALTGTQAPAASPPASPSPGSTGTGTSATASPSPTGTPAVSLAALAAAERAAQVARVAACDGAASAQLARDLCLIAASEAQHAAAIEALAEEVGDR
jgi:hypothetical protein